MDLLNKKNKGNSVLVFNTQGALRFLMILFFFVLVFAVKSAIAINCAYTESESEQSTTSGTFQDAATLNFTADDGDYIVIAAFELCGATSYPVEARLLIEGVEEGLVSQQFETLSYSSYYSMGWIKKATFTEGSKTIKVQYRSTYASFITAYIRNIHIFAWKAEGLQYTATETQQNLTTTESSLASLNFTPSATQDYLILASVEGKPGSTSNSIILRLKVDSVEKNRIDSEGSATTDYRGHGIVLLQNLDTTSHTIQITGQAESGTMYARRIRIVAIPIGGLTHYSAADETETSASTTYVDKLSYSPTISNTGDHIIFATSETNIPGSSYQKSNRLLIDSSQYHELIEYPQDGTDYVSTFFLKKLSLSAGSHTFKIQHKGSSLIYSVYTKNARIVAIQVPPPTAVKLRSFESREYFGGILLQWHTGYEVNNLGFHIYREEDGQLVRLTPEPVAGSALLAGSCTALTAGRHYHWWDISAPSSQLSAMRYWLKDIDLSGKETMHGPVMPMISREPIPEKFRPELLSEIGWRLQERYRDYWRVQGLREKLALKRLEIRGAPRGRGLRTVNKVPLRTGPRGLEVRGFYRQLDPSTNEVQKYLAGRSAVKLFVKEEGWYRVSQPELVVAGLSSKVNPRYLQLYVEGREQPIRVIGGEDGRFGPGDGIEFYGVGLDTPLTDTRVYWLIEGFRPGKRIYELKSDRGPLGSLSLSSFPYTVEKKDRAVYFAALRNGDEGNFFGPVVYMNRVDQIVELEHLDGSTAEDALLEVMFQGVTEGSHRVKVLFNEVEVGEVSFEGQSQGLFKVEVSQSGLLEGENLVSVVGQGGEMDVSLLDFIRLTYWHLYRADDDSLKCRAQGGSELTVDGFSDSRVRVMDITDPDNVFEVFGGVRNGELGYGVRFRVPESGERMLLAFTEEKAKSPMEVFSDRPSFWHQERKGYDLIIISHRDFFDSLQPLKSLRESQGLEMALVDVEDLYDEFSFGNKSPQAMKDFLTLAKSNWRKSPRYVLLVGDASYDPRDYLGLGDFDFLPTKLIDTAYMETASDDWFVDIDNDGLPEMAIGRLPVRTLEEANAVVSKIVGYERSGITREALLVADVNDGFDFEGASEEIRALLPSSLMVRKIYRGQFGSDSEVREVLLGSINEGPLLVNFIGHGSVEVWRGNILTSDDAEGLINKGLSFFVNMTCFNGFFQAPYAETLAEALLKAEKGGAIAVWTSSGMTEPGGQTVMDKELIRLLFSGESLTLGEATAKAKASVGDQDVRRTWTLFGDPATRLKN